MDDVQLVRAACSGDLSAFSAMFDRYAAQVHDLAQAMLRDRITALEVVEATFLEAGLRIAGLQEQHRLAVWLLAVTRRNAAMRAGPSAGADRYPLLAPDDQERVRLASLVWEAVADLPLRDRALIDLDLRHGLGGQDLADTLGVTLSQAVDLQARMRDRIEKGLAGYLIARTAEGRCSELTKVLVGWDGRFIPESSARIARHVERCGVCNQIRFGLPSPFVLYAAALPAPFPAAVRPRVLERAALPRVTAADPFVGSQEMP
ncbi:MAG: sigma-70 family RNA polymerase sigma factor [Acidimicrobiales bacterium]